MIPRPVAVFGPFQGAASSRRQPSLGRDRSGHSLQTTAPVNEAYMRLVDYTRMQSVDETAEGLPVSYITVMREWKSAKAWVYRELAGPTANGH